MTPRDPFKMSHHRELEWVAPFLCIVFMALGLLRPLPRFTSPSRSRIVVDAQGVQVPIAMPFRGSFLAWCGFSASGYLEKTHAPETLVNAGGPLARASFTKNLMALVYPEVSKKDSLWAELEGGPGHYGNLEVSLAQDAGAYLGDCGGSGTIPLLRTAGLPALSVMWYPKNWDEAIFAEARVQTALVGEPERGEVLISRYQQAFADIKRELHPEILTHKPRVLMMGSSFRDRGYFYIKSYRNDYSKLYFPPAGIENVATSRLIGERQDAERILSMDPDIILLTGTLDTPYPTEGPKEFMHDPRWLGLKAVREKRVYRMYGGGGLGGLIYQPLYDRFMAEIAHPDRMQPRLRQVLRDRIMSEFGYLLSDDQIDKMINVGENKDSAGADRFMRDYQVKNEEEPGR